MLYLVYPNAKYQRSDWNEPPCAIHKQLRIEMFNIVQIVIAMQEVKIGGTIRKAFKARRLDTSISSKAYQLVISNTYWLAHLVGHPIRGTSLGGLSRSWPGLTQNLALK
eukprot:1955678-Amphidinium_carterae.1